MRLLILGASGKVGRLVMAALRGGACHGVQAIGVARDGTSDIRWDPDLGGDPLPPVDCVVALWGVVPGAGDLDANITLARAAVEAGRQTGARRVLHCSSVAVYGPDGSPFAEEDALAGTSPYARAKIAMEQIIPDDGTQTILRIGSVVGAESLAASLRTGQVNLHRFPDGRTPRRSYIAPGDIARALGALARAEGVPYVLNFGAPKLVEMADLVKAAGVTPTYELAPEGALAEAAMDMTRLIRTTGPIFNCHTAQDMIADWRRWDGTAP